MYLSYRSINEVFCSFTAKPSVYHSSNSLVYLLLSDIIQSVSCLGKGRIVGFLGKSDEMKKQFTILLVIVLMLVGYGQVIAATQYTITDLGTLGGTYSYANAINDSGQIVGESTFTDGNYRAFLYKNGLMADVGTLGGVSSSALAINNQGQIAGYARTSDNKSHAFLWDNFTMKDLGSLNGYHSSARGINEIGQIVGSTGSQSYAVLYEGGKIKDLGVLPGDYMSFAYAINNNGEIVGYSYSSSINRSAFLYSNGIMTDLGTIGGHSSFAYAINDNSQIVGVSWNENDIERAFLYQNGEMIDLGSLDGISHSRGLGINNAGQIVGLSLTSGADWDWDSRRAIIYENGTMYDLNKLTNNPNWILSIAKDINNKGQIVGSGYINGQEHAFLMTPIPEPCTIVLLTLGGLLLRSRKN